MKTIIFYAIVVLIAVIFISKTTINFSPFRMEAERKIYALGWFLFFSGMVIMLVSNAKDSYEEGYRKGADKVIEIIKKSESNKTENS